MTTKEKRKLYPPKFKAEALKLAAKAGDASAARELGIYESQLYSWRPAASIKLSTRVRETELESEVREVAKLKRQLAE